jgi:twitching motility protein PilT
MNIDELLSAMAKHGASDLHIKSGEPPVFRIGGELMRAKAAVFTAEEARELLAELLDERLRQDLEKRGYADFSRQVEGVGRFRCNVYRQLGRLSAAVRRVKPIIPTYQQLGLPASISKCSDFESGLVLVGGATGSGKTTTIAAVLNDINHKRRCHILTIEDPVEYVFEDDKALVNQREVGVDVPNFEEGLRSAMREDPDVMLLGEMRDAETIETALTAAETGHLVFGTIHAPGCAQTIGRILEMFPSERHHQMRSSLAFNLRCIVNQKLLPGLEKGAIVPAVEVMFITPIIKKHLLEGEDHKIAEALGKDTESGSENFNRVLARLYHEKKVSMDSALRAAPNPEELRMAMRGITFST